MAYFLVYIPDKNKLFLRSMGIYLFIFAYFFTFIQVICKYPQTLSLED